MWLWDHAGQHLVPEWRGASDQTLLSSGNMCIHSSCQGCQRASTTRALSSGDRTGVVECSVLWQTSPA